MTEDLPLHVVLIEPEPLRQLAVELGFAGIDCEMFVFDELDRAIRYLGGARKVPGALIVDISYLGTCESPALAQLEAQAHLEETKIFVMTESGKATDVDVALLGPFSFGGGLQRPTRSLVGDMLARTVISACRPDKPGAEAA
ncbi:MAG: hypothetical protein V3V08_17490 [Nannocystaceae bacterium]